MSENEDGGYEQAQREAVAQGALVVGTMPTKPNADWAPLLLVILKGLNCRIALQIASGRIAIEAHIYGRICFGAQNLAGSLRPDFGWEWSLHGSMNGCGLTVVSGRGAYIMYSFQGSDAMHPARLVVATIAVSICLAAASPANAAPLTATNSTFAMLDSSQTTRPLDITGFGAVSDLNITIQFAKCDDPGFSSPGGCIGTGFSFDREIQFWLTNPNNTTTIFLVLQDTYSGETPGSGTHTITFDDSAATAVGGASILSGTFRPVGSLAAFNGQEAHGVWTLGIQDTVGADPLMYFSSHLDINGTAVPDPGSTLLLLGMGLVGLRAWRKRR